MEQLLNIFRNFDYSRIMNWSTLIQAKPAQVWQFAYWYIGLTALCLVIGVVTLFLRKLHTELRSMLLAYCWTFAIAGGLLYFFRVQRIPYLGTDILRTLQLVAMLIWGTWIAFFSTRKIKQQALSLSVQERKQKYLPKPHSK